MGRHYNSNRVPGPVGEPIITRALRDCLADTDQQPLDNCTRIYTPSTSQFAKGTHS